MAVQRFQYARYTTQYLLNYCGVQAREPFVLHVHPLALPPVSELEVQTPSGTNLNDAEVGRLVEKWVDVFHEHWKYMTARLTYIHLHQLTMVLTYDSVDTSVPIGVKLKKVWTDFRAMKIAWETTYEGQGFSIWKTQ